MILIFIQRGFFQGRSYNSLSGKTDVVRDVFMIFGEIGVSSVVHSFKSEVGIRSNSFVLDERIREITS